MAGFWMGEETQERMDLWLTRALVFLSFAAHLTLALLAGIHRRRDSGMRRFLVWFAYYATEIGTPMALTKVFIDTASVDSEQQLLVAYTYREQQMFAFWAPFLLLHLGRPDNISSYALDNKGLSPTHIAGIIIAIGGAIYGSYKQRFMRGDGPLRVAFFIMLFFGSYKYVERAVALHRASFDNIRRSNKKKFVRRFTVEEEGRKRDNDDALLDAHGLLGVTMGTFADYQANRRRHIPSYSGWKDVSKVIEMEASLMYDMLYTKASVVHTWGGYIIHIASPPATAATLYLFHSKEGKAMERADLMVTYTLLVGTLVLDLRWLLRALGSTWTYAFLLDSTEKDKEEESTNRHRGWILWANSAWPGWIKKAGCWAGRQSWYCVRRLLVSMDASRLSLRSGPSGHRLLPGSSIGQRNLLHECTSPPQGRLEKMMSFLAGLGKKKIDVKDELLEVMCTYLLLSTRTIDGMVDPIRQLDEYMRSNAKNYSFESNLIALHVATDIFLLCRPTSPGIESEASAKYEKLIRVLSDYMMFLLAQRQHMVLPPGHEASDYKKACLDLKEVLGGRQSSGSQTTNETKQLANILLNMNETQGSDRKASLLRERNKALALGAYWALKLLHELEPVFTVKAQTDMASYGNSSGNVVQRLDNLILLFAFKAKTDIKRYKARGEQSKVLNYVLECILASWVRLLIFTSVKCSTECHAKQLSCGGEPLTLIWLMNQHRHKVSYKARDKDLRIKYL